ncbi:vanadium-dependent haloperoxidase [Azohydromonas sp.]|uniref:vanadium-dependent haloperoxidase n=1 Tax=Azohydromonas sp. TaxID=1872666 RepID=UPI002B794571|nr:vanadium-dependent haloperoxidase [Azohydromonas sp.]HMM87000.1 vanadium-dependent haloperoxidase [Azohydromonas sp.]
MQRLHVNTTFATVLLAVGLPAAADAVTDWNRRADGFITESKLGTPPAIRVMAVVQTAVHDAVARLPAPAARSPAAIDAAVATAHRVTLGRLLPAQQPAVESAVTAALAAIADGPAKAAGVDAGTRAAQAVLAARAADAPGPDRYRPQAAPGVYVPTMLPAAATWAQRTPWLMTHAAQFRPAAPPALASDQWARDVAEVKALGAKAGGQRSAEQTAIARFWEYSLPAIYHGVVRSQAEQPARDALANARLFAAVAQAIDDAMVAVFDAKYHHHSWRPVTAIRNGDVDGHPATERDAGWSPLVDTPMHPEYPGAHSILAAAVGTVLEAEFGAAPAQPLATSSPTAQGATRRWTRVDDFVREVSDARIYGGMHFRFSTAAGEAMGRQIGRLAVERVLHAAPSMHADATAPR